MKKILILITCFLYLSYWPQVGINTKLPKVTLDVVAKTTDGSKAEGIIAPRLTGDQIKAADSQYGMDQIGIIVYATNAATTPSSKTAQITLSGYYYYDGDKWRPLFSSLGSVNVNCNANSFQGSYSNGVAMTSANKFSVTITNNSFSTVNISFSISDITLSGIPGLNISSVYPSVITLNSGDSQMVEYSLTGTPGSSGTLSGLWSKLSLNCLKTITF